jgi:hypothetical protein
MGACRARKWRCPRTDPGVVIAAQNLSNGAHDIAIKPE